LSAKATFWAWSQRKISSTEKLVLLCLSDNHNGDTGRCDPSVKYIADKTGLDRKTVMQCISRLDYIGLISTQKRPGTSTDYTLSTSTNIGSAKNGTSQKRVVPKTDTTSTNIGQTPVPKLGHKSITESKKNLKQLDFSSWPQKPSDEVWSDYKKLRQAKRAPISQTVIRSMGKQIAKLPHMTVDEILTECISRGWQGLNADWILNTGGPNGQNRPTSRRESLAERGDRETREILADIAAREANNSRVGQDAPTVRPQMGQPGRPSQDGERDVFEGVFAVVPKTGTPDR
jgi:hypothetical protein